MTRLPKSVFYLLVIVVGTLFLMMIYNRLFIDHDIVNVLEGVSWPSSFSQVFLLFIVVVLAFFNVLLESYKWHNLIAWGNNLNIWISIKSILVGFFYGTITPFQLGDYPGRLTYIDQSLRSTALSATWVSSVTQNICNVTVGIIGIMLLSAKVDFIDIHNSLTVLIGALTIIFSIVTLFSIDKITRWASRLKFLERFDIQEVHFSGLMISKNLLLSLLRYATYVVQYYLLLCFWGLEMSMLDGFMAIASIYLLQSLIIVPASISLLARGGIALFIFSFWEFNPALILLTSLSLWLINLVIPALLGFILIVSTSKK